MLRAENKTGQDLCCANSIPKEQSSRTRQGWDIKPHTDKHPSPCSQCLRTAFQPPQAIPWAKPFSQRAFVGLSGNQHHQLSLGRAGGRGLQGFPEGSHSSISSLFSQVLILLPPQQGVHNLHCKAQRSWWKAQHVPDSRKSKIHSAPSTLPPFKHKTQARTKNRKPQRIIFIQTKANLL